MRSWLLVILFFATSTLSADGLWNRYNTLKANHFDSLTLTAQNYAEMAEVTKQLKRPDIEAWDYNDAAYALIEQFKTVTVYDEATQQIALDKKALRKTDRIAFRTTLRANIDLLNEAHVYLLKASSLDHSSKVIKSNKEFIQWVKGFIAKNN